MPQLKLNFTKVVILSFSRTPGSGTVKVSCSPSKTVAKAMGWDDLPDWQKSATPVGDLTAGIVEFTPNDGNLQKHAFDLTTTAVRDFEIVRKLIKKGKTANKSKSFKMELHCSVDFTDINGAKKLEAYMQTVGESTMRVTYEPEAEQQDLPGTTESSQEELEEVVLDTKRRRATAAEAD